jgi:hypothetical protein
MQPACSVAISADSIAICAIVSITATVFLPDYTNRDISQEDAYDAAAAERSVQAQI